MITDIIIQYLRDNRRLIVPGLGVFIIKPTTGQAVFSELMRDDDGVLRGIMNEQQGMNDIRSAGMIGRFVFEVKNTVVEGGRFAIGRLGYFHAGEHGQLLFEPMPVVKRYVAPSVDRSEVPSQDEMLCGTAPASEIATPSAAQAPLPKTDNVTAKRVDKGKTVGSDKFIYIAIVVLALSVAAIVYGVFVSRHTLTERDAAQMDSLRTKISAPAPDNN